MSVPRKWKLLFLGIKAAEAGASVFLAYIIFHAAIAASAPHLAACVYLLLQLSFHFVEALALVGKAAALLEAEDWEPIIQLTTSFNVRRYIVVKVSLKMIFLIFLLRAVVINPKVLSLAGAEDWGTLCLVELGFVHTLHQSRQLQKRLYSNNLTPWTLWLVFRVQFVIVMLTLLYYLSRLSTERPSKLLLDYFLVVDLGLVLNEVSRPLHEGDRFFRAYTKLTIWHVFLIPSLLIDYKAVKMIYLQQTPPVTVIFGAFLVLVNVGIVIALVKIRRLFKAMAEAHVDLFAPVQLQEESPGLTELEIGQIGVRVFEKEEEMCAICHQSIARGSDIAELVCEHPFHRPCLVEWLHHSTSCPLCRRSLRPSGDNPPEIRSEVPSAV
eukprot:TRINITY_DN3295_c0_g1_i1.p1 TRINITY_DN3295_c0_g1~~TRINITY_DN3295_c0_g1_i1.p1  ORF type:complete len:382 (+),score=79.39 TRINITY_DN3295_c0_g1_i1:51-1196(+)